MNEGELLSWEECRKQIIDRCVFFKSGDVWKASPNSMRVLQSPKQKLLLDSLIYLTNFLPENSRNIERIYYLLYNFKNSLNKKCPGCGKELVFHSLYNGFYKTCGSKSCKAAVSMETMRLFYRNNYGCDSVFQIPGFDLRAKQTRKEKYGDENFSNKEKRKRTCLELYGVENPFQSEEVKAKSKETMLLRYGVDHPMHSEFIVNGMKSRYKNKTGYEYTVQNPEVVKKGRESYKEKFGYDHWMQNPEVLKKREEIYFEETGYRQPLQNPEIKEKGRISYFNKTGYECSLQNPDARKKNNDNYFKKTGYDCPSHNPEVRDKAKNTAIKNTGFPYSLCNPEIRKKAFDRIIEEGSARYSKISQELFDSIYQKLSDKLKEDCYYATCKTNDHSREFGKRDECNQTYYFYDFVITSIKICIEFDGDYWHSKAGAVERDQRKQK